MPAEIVLKYYKMEENIDKLIKYFQHQPNVVMAFLFGSRAEKTERTVSDWDIGVYFKPYEYMEIETDVEYEDEYRIWSDLIDILETDNVDLIVLNRATPSLFYQVLTKGFPLIVKDENLYIDLLCKLNYEAVDWIDFVADYYEISERSKSISPFERVRLLRYLHFLESEFNEIEEDGGSNIPDDLNDGFFSNIF
jgi:predicted nucleotidyltransferase